MSFFKGSEFKFRVAPTVKKTFQLYMIIPNSNVAIEF